MHLAVWLLALTLSTGTAMAQSVKVVATFSVLADMVRTIAGDKVSVTELVGPDGDVELYKPTVADDRAVAEARLVVANGLGSEPWLDAQLKRTRFGGVKQIASDGVKVWRAKAEKPGEEGEPDPHAWQNAANGPIYARNIAAALSKVDPANANGYRTRADAYAEELRQLDAWVKQRISSVPAERRKVITSHDGFGYLARAYGVRMLAARGFTNDKEPTARDVSRLIDQVKRDKVSAIFIENMNDPRVIERIAREAGARIGGTLYSDALSKQDGPAGTYPRMIRHNIETLVAGMAHD
jgi:zinc/manganese transport system substrate-binding protein